MITSSVKTRSCGSLAEPSHWLIDPQNRALTELVITPRQASRSPQISVSTSQAIGRISAESICPYPPGIPVLIPGEIITAEALSYLQQILDLGGELVGCSDPTLEYISVVNQ